MKPGPDRSCLRSAEPADGCGFAALRSWGLLLALCALLSGCRTPCREYFSNGWRVGPNYVEPDAPVADEWIDDADDRVQSELPFDGWWQLFDDPTLDMLVQTARLQNLTLGEAGFRVLEARAQQAMAGGSLLPQLQAAEGSHTRQQLSREGGLPGSGLENLSDRQRSFDSWTMGGRLAWELDFWGQFRRAVEAADAELEASVNAYDDVLVLLLSDVAAAYIEIRILEQRIAYARRNIELQQSSLRLVEAKLQQGSATRLDVAQAVTNVSRTEAILPRLQRPLRQAQNRLCVLLGFAPQDLGDLLQNSQGVPRAPEQVAVGIPAELLRRRPDVRRAEREVAAQSARIGVAEAELYPAFTISGTVFVQAGQLDNLFRNSSLASSNGPGFHWNVLNYGRLQQAVRAEEARFMQKVLQYQNTVLTANREAEDAIVAFLRAHDEAQALQRGVEAAELSRNLIQELYRAGKADFGRMFFADYVLVEQQDELALAEGAIALSVVELYRALGGGWQIRGHRLPPHS